MEKKSNVAEVHRKHRWYLEDLVGARSCLAKNCVDPTHYCDEVLRTLVYARNVEIPDHIPDAPPQGNVVIHFYESRLEDEDVLHRLIEISQVFGGQTRIVRGSEPSSPGFILHGSKITKIVMPQLDYRRNALSTVAVHVSFLSADYVPDMSKAKCQPHTGRKRGFDVVGSNADNVVGRPNASGEVPCDR